MDIWQRTLDVPRALDTIAWMILLLRFIRAACRDYSCTALPATLRCLACNKQLQGVQQLLSKSFLLGAGMMACVVG